MPFAADLLEELQEARILNLAVQGDDHMERVRSGEVGAQLPLADALLEHQVHALARAPP